MSEVNTSVTLDSHELVEGKPLRTLVGDTPVCVTRIGSEVFAIADTCSHSDASLSEGSISDYKIECWLHGAEFDLRTGEALTPPAVSAVETFRVDMNDTHVTISKKGK